MPFTFSATDDDRNQIRWMLNMNYTQEDVPDAVIDADTVLGAAKDWADEQINEDADPNPRQLGIYQRAIKYRAASILCGTKAQLIRTGAGGASEGVEAISWVQRAQKLERDSILEIQKLFDDEGVEEPRKPVPKYNLFRLTRC